MAWHIFSKNSAALRSFLIFWLLSGRSNLWVNILLSLTQFMNSSETRMDMLALVTLSRLVLTAMNSSRSGWSQEMVSMSAPRRPC